MSTHAHQLTRNIWAVGRNYADHASEMKAELPKAPLFFLKSGNCLSLSSKIILPKWSNEIQHEIEIAYLLDEDLKYSHMTLALDLTARDAQNIAKQKGQPWTLAKSFTDSCPIGPWISLADIPQPQNLEFALLINNQTTQISTWNDMLFKPDALLTYAREHYPVTAHDIILTGTPSGVGQLTSGDQLKAYLRDITSPHQNLLEIHWDIE